jgi:hypothetical protein
MLDNTTLLFALEAYKGEIADRIKFDKIKQKYYTSDYYRMGAEKIRFKLWKTGHYSAGPLRDIEREVIRETDDKLKMNLLVRYRDKPEYSVRDFVLEIKKAITFLNVKLAVIDHLHYFSFPDEKTENQALKEIMNLLRDVVLQIEVPIVLIAHLRKLEKFNASLCPDLSEVMGSSEITKNATTVITMAPAHNIPQVQHNLFPTYFRVCKERFESGTDRYLMISDYNLDTGRYEPDYRVERITKGGAESEELTETTRPYWAKDAILMRPPEVKLFKEKYTGRKGC